MRLQKAWMFIFCEWVYYGRIYRQFFFSCVYIPTSLTGVLCPKIMRWDAVSPQKIWLLCLRTTLVVFLEPLSVSSISDSLKPCGVSPQMEDSPECSCHAMWRSDLCSMKCQASESSNCTSLGGSFCCKLYKVIDQK